VTVSTFDIKEWALSNIVGSYVAGDNVRGVCPSCGRPDKFGINYRIGVFNCWRASCGYRGKIAFLVADVTRISLQQARVLVGELDIGASRRVSFFTAAMQPPPQQPVDCPLPATYVSCYDPTTNTYDIPPYLIKRISSTRAVRDMGIGYAYEGRERDRIIIPVTCDAGRAWVARDMTGKAKARYLAPDGNDAAMRRLTMDTPGYVPGGDLVLVEGVFDAMRIYEAGFHARALLGSVLHEQQRPLFFSLPRSTRITVGLDPDVPSTKIKAIARALSIRFALRVVFWPGGDPGSLSVGMIADSLRTAVDLRL
jgi:hypothetical protein